MKNIATRWGKSVHTERVSPRNEAPSSSGSPVKELEACPQRATLGTHCSPWRSNGRCEVIPHATSPLQLWLALDLPSHALDWQRQAATVPWTTGRWVPEPHIWVPQSNCYCTSLELETYKGILSPLPVDLWPLWPFISLCRFQFCCILYSDTKGFLLFPHQYDKTTALQNVLISMHQTEQIWGWGQFVITS